MAEQKVDQETLMALLKEKAKELKTANKKLNKVEEKFVESHKTCKALTQDRETFIAFLHLVFPEDVLEEVLLPDDQVGLYDIEHLKQFWLLQQSKSSADQVIQIDKLQKDLESAQAKLAETEDSDLEVVSLKNQLKEMEGQVTGLQSEVAGLQSKLAESDSKLADQESTERELTRLKDKVKQLEKDNSESQAKLLMSAYGGNSASSGMGFSLPSLAGPGESEKQKKRIQELEREVSELTNQTLRQRQEIQDFMVLQEKKVEEEEQKTPGQESETLSESALQDQIEQATAPLQEEIATLRSLNVDIEQKLTSLMSEYAVVKSDSEIIKQKARQMLIEKDEEIERLKGKSTDSDAKTNPDSGASPSQAVDSGKNKYENISATPGGGLDKDYIKNILLKYLEYQALGEEKEALTLEKVLFTILQASQQELSSLEKARVTQTSGFLSYFYSQGSGQVAKPLKVGAYFKAHLQHNNKAEVIDLDKE